MDDETADIQRRIAEANEIQEQLTQLRDQIRQQQAQLDIAIRQVSDVGPSPSDELRGSKRKVRGLRHGHSRA